MSQPGEQHVPRLALVAKTVDNINEIGNRFVDVAICIDVTGSMGHEACAARNKVMGVFDTLKKQHPGKRFRLALVGYRDYCDEKRFNIVDFTEDISSVKTVLAQLIENGDVTGGGDAPEDVAGAFQQLIGLSWSEEGIRQILFITDAPAHGLAYHEDNMADDYPDGDPTGLNIEDQMTLMASKNMGVMFVKMNASTDKMNTALRLAYQRGRVPGSKTNYILADMSVQLAQAKTERSSRVSFYDEDDDMDRGDSVYRGGLSGDIDYGEEDMDRGSSMDHDSSMVQASPSDDIFSQQLLEAVCSQL